jgi:hypothetical protein
MPSSYRRSRLVDRPTRSHDPGWPSFPSPSRDSSRGARRVRRSWVPRRLTQPGDRRGGHLRGLDVLLLRRQGRKEDLYTHVTRIELERLFAGVGPFPIPTETDPDTFWSTLEGYYLRLMTTLAASPQLAALIRGSPHRTTRCSRHSRSWSKRRCQGFRRRWPPASGRELCTMTCRLVC